MGTCEFCGERRTTTVLSESWARYGIAGASVCWGIKGCNWFECLQTEIAKRILDRRAAAKPKLEAKFKPGDRILYLGKHKGTLTRWDERSRFWWFTFDDPTYEGSGGNASTEEDLELLRDGKVEFERRRVA